MSESTPKTSAIFVRLTRDFPQGSGHRRAGIELTPGPQPIEVEVTDEQLALLEGDRYIEIVDDAEAQKWIDRLGEPQPKTSTEVAEESEQGNTGRNYGDGNEGGSDGSDDGEEGDEGQDLEAIDKLADLKAIAEAEEVDITGLNSKAQVREAIQAARDAKTSEEE